MGRCERSDGEVRTKRWGGANEEMGRGELSEGEGRLKSRYVANEEKGRRDRRADTYRQMTWQTYNEVYV